MKPILIVVAGPNGSGKTTVTHQLRQDQWSDGVEYLNPDDIARERFGDWSQASFLKAAKWTEERREQLLRERKSIAFETVFSRGDKVDFLKAAHAAGYFIRVFFVGTNNPQINASRIMTRVMGGGHDVPIAKILSRYAKSMGNLSAAIAVADRVYVYDNSEDDTPATLCARTCDGRLRKIHVELPRWVSDALGGLPLHPDFDDGRR